MPAWYFLLAEITMWLINTQPVCCPWGQGVPMPGNQLTQAFTPLTSFSVSSSLIVLTSCELFCPRYTRVLLRFRTKSQTSDCLHITSTRLTKSRLPRSVPHSHNVPVGDYGSHRSCEGDIFSLWPWGESPLFPGFPWSLRQIIRKRKTGWKVLRLSCTHCDILHWFCLNPEVCEWGFQRCQQGVCSALSGSSGRWVWPKLPCKLSLFLLACLI